jgi:hypothetical protein
MKYILKTHNESIVNNISYDTLEHIIIYLDIGDIINFLLSSQKIYTLYIKCDETYGCNKITNRIIKGCALFFRINDKINYNSQDKKLLATNLIEMYNLYKNNKKYNNSDVLISMIENNMKSNELFRCFCLKSKFSINKIQESDLNTISSSDMIYIIVNSDKCKLKILLTSFLIESKNIALCIKYILKYKKKDYSRIITTCIDYLFKEISNNNTKYFIDIVTYFIFYDESYLLKYFEKKLERYSQSNILNIDCITLAMYDNLQYGKNNCDNEKTHNCDNGDNEKTHNLKNYNRDYYYYLKKYIYDYQFKKNE